MFKQTSPFHQPKIQTGQSLSTEVGREKRHLTDKRIEIIALRNHGRNRVKLLEKIADLSYSWNKNDCYISVKIVT